MTKVPHAAICFNIASERLKISQKPVGARQTRSKRIIYLSYTTTVNTGARRATAAAFEVVINLKPERFPIRGPKVRVLRTDEKQ